ncbi:RNI-like superfamily protein [Wolffia australiana]
MYHHHPASAADSDALKRKAVAAPPPSGGVAKKRGSYNCGRCGLPKKGHVCVSTGSPVHVAAGSPSIEVQRLRRALSFDDIAEPGSSTPCLDSTIEDLSVEDEIGDELAGGFLPVRVLVDVLSRLPPKDLSVAAGVSKRWKDCVGRVWRSAEELRIKVPRRSQVSFVGSVLQKCSSLVRLSLRMESDINATVLACIAFSCPNLEALEITLHDTAVNRITGDALGRFVAEKRYLNSLKIEGCSNLGFLNLSSSSLHVLWLSGLHSLSKSLINCPNLGEISLDFGQHETESTDLTLILEGLSRTCSKLKNIHVASSQLSNPAVLALTGGKLRDLRMLSLVLGSKITDAAVASIVSSFTSLELLDLSGSSISDSGIGMICNVYPDSLSRLLLALCPNITSSGVQFATAQLPLLRLIDCGMSMQDSASHNDLQEDDVSCYVTREKSTRVAQPMYQKLIIKHGQLKKLSLWGCSALDALHLNCPRLSDLNLNSCTNLHPERLVLECPSLDVVHASGCKSMLLGLLQEQIGDDPSQLARKRLGDGSKRVRAPQFVVQPHQSPGGKGASPIRRCAVVAD